MGINDDEIDNAVRNLVALNGMRCKYVVPNNAPDTAEKSEMQCTFRIDPNKKRNFGQWCADGPKVSRTTGEKIGPICVTVQSTVNPKMGVDGESNSFTQQPKPTTQQPKPPVNADPNSFPQPLPPIENYSCPATAPKSGTECPYENKRCVYDL
jgi:hypothetical protein